IVFNGEIYNFIALRRQLISQGHKFYTNTDTEVIVHLYEEYKENCVKYLEGMFAFAIWDTKIKELMLARDIAGEKQLYYSLINDNIFFASETKSILQYERFNREINYKSLSDYFTFNYVPHDKETIFNNIFKLPPAQMLTYRSRELTVKKYWNPSNMQIGEKDENYYIDTLEELLKKSIKKMLISDVALGAFLSGGVDSSFIVALMSEEMKQPVKTFSVGFEGPEFFNELPDAKIISNMYHTDHHELMIKAVEVEKYLPKLAWAFDNLYADPVALPTYIISEFARKNVTVCLGGDGSDELFAGYERYLVENLFDHFKRVPSSLFDITGKFLNFIPKLTRVKKALKGFGVESFNNRYAVWLTRLDDETKKKIFSREIISRFNNYQSSMNIFENIYGAEQTRNNIEQMQYIDFKNWLGNQHLMRVDRMSMANSLEIREPFLDKNVVDFCFSMPTSLKIKGITKKYILRKIMKKYLPAHTLNKAKHGFTVPVDLWFQKRIKDFFLQVITDSSFEGNRYFSKETIISMVNWHANGKANYGSTFWAILNFIYWHKTFIESPVKVIRPEIKIPITTGKKILLLTGDFPPIKGGISTFLYELFVRFPENSVSIITRQPLAKMKELPAENNFNIVYLKSRLAKYKLVFPLLLLLKSVKLIRGARFDQIICGQSVIGLVGYIIKKFLGIPYSVFFYGAEFRGYPYLRYILRIIMNNAANVFTISNFSKNEYLKQNLKNKNIHILNPGVNVSSFKPGTVSDNLNEKKIILTVSRLDENKGIDTVINLMPEIWKKFPETEYLIVGKGPCETKLKKLANSIDKDRIIFAGEVSDEQLPTYYNLCDVFVLLTRDVPEKGYIEGFGIVFLEASACGKPIVAGKTGGVVDAVIDNLTGLLVEPSNEKEIVEKILLLLTDKALAAKLGAAGRKRAMEEFQWRKKSETLQKWLDAE
ncbi:MAG: asparagine synthase (glutamine-hydrolyzing), partial [Elusimicrobiota bacterium]